MLLTMTPASYSLVMTIAVLVVCHLRSRAWHQDGERRSSTAATLLKDAASAGAASLGRRRGGASSYDPAC